MNTRQLLSRGRPWLAVAAALGLALLLRYPVADIPLERDEGEYAYIGQRWRQGEVPYQDSFDQKPPGVFLAYALLQAGFGTSPAALHWGAQVYTLGTLGLIILLGRKLFCLRTGVLAAALAAFLITDPSVLGNAANTETFMVLPLTAALLATLRAAGRRSLPAGFLAGALSAAAVLFKQVAVFNLAFCLFLVVVAPRRRRLLAAALLLGAAAVLAGTCAYFWAAGAWDEFYDCTIGYNLGYANQTPLSEYPANFWAAFGGILRSCWPVYLLALLGLAAGLSRCGPEAAGTRILAGWLACSFLGVATAGYFRQHYFIQLIPAVALLAAAGAGWLATLAVPVPLRKPCVVCGAAVLYGVACSLWYYLPGPPEAKCRRLYGYNPFPESIPVADYLARHSWPTDCVFVVGSEPQILYYARRKSASRYIFLYPLMIPLPRARDLQLGVLEELRREPPKFMVTVFIADSLLREPETPSCLLDGLHPLLLRSYRLVGVVPLGKGTALAKWWKTAPPWYDTPTPECSLALWQRSDPSPGSR